MHRRITALLALLCPLLVLAALARPVQDDAFEELRARGRALMAEGSHAAALEVWQDLAARAEAGSLELNEGQRRWLALWVADCSWRAEAERRDESARDAARAALAALAPLELPVEERDRVWAEARESLGDLDWARERTWNLQPALASYLPALEWWGRSSDLDLARERWLAIFWRLVQPDWAPGDFELSFGRGQIPLELAEDALRLARDDDERGRAHLVVGRLALQSSDSPRRQARALEHLEAAIALGSATSALDDALWTLAQHLEQTGRFTRDAEGRFVREPDLVAAVARYRELRERFDEGGTRWWRAAGQRLEQLTGASVGLWVPGTFLPGSDVGYRLTWRNVERVELALHAVDLARDIRLDDPDESPWSWLQTIRLEAPVRTWTHAADGAEDHRERHADLALEPAPAVGAYVLEARAGGTSARALVLVTDAALLAFGEGSEHVFWVTRASDGEPLAGAAVDVHARVRLASGGRAWRGADATADGDGLARAAVGATASSQVLALAATSAGPALCLLNSNSRPAPDGWGLHVVTDRPAYRPDQTVRWSVMARVAGEDGAWEPPSGRSLTYELRGPRGEVVDDGALDLDTFGTAAGAFDTTLDQTLGVYRLRFASGGDTVGEAELFRLEEYVRPEFEVRVALPEDEAGRPAVFVLGDEVRAEVTAQTYAGAPVAGAAVEFVVRRERHWEQPEPRGEYAWFTRALDSGGSRPWWGGGGEEILRTDAVTDAEGRAAVAFDTWGLDEGTWKFTVEARVTDALRREVTGSGDVLVASHAFRARVETEHRLFRPGAALDATVITEDPNGNPVAASGSVALLRLRSFDEDEWRAQGGRIAPEMVFPHEVEEEVQRIALATGDDGRARWSPTPPGEGAYLLRFEAPDARSGGRVVGETHVWVCGEGTTELGLRTGGIELVLDAEAAAEGGRTPLLLTSERSGRAVLFVVESKGALDVRVVRVSGTARLVQLELAERHVPRATLSIWAVEDGRLLHDAETLTVAPTRHFLSVEATLDREVYAPGDDARLALVVRDHAGEPVAGHLAVSLFDESLTAIQAELGADPRLTFFGSPGWWRAGRGSSFDGTRYGRFTLTEDGGWQDERDRARDGADGRGAEKLGARADRGQHDFMLGQGLESLGYMGDSEVAFESAGLTMAPAARAGRVVPAGIAGADGAASPNVRVDFRETALWDANVLTDADGRASLAFTWPDSTTRWRLAATACDADSSFGVERSSPARTTLPLLLRLATPRFLVAGDTAVVSTLVRNDTDAALTATVALASVGDDSGEDALPAAVLGALADGALADGALEYGAAQPGDAEVTVPAGGEVTVDWVVEARRAGDATLRATLVGGGRSDGIERPLPVLAHGLEVVIAAASVSESERDELVVALPPAAPGTTSFDVVVTPSLASTAVAALPYLADYPYGCLEQTLSRFVPTVVTLGALERLGFDRERVAAATFDPPTHARAPRDERTPTLPKIDAMVADGLARVLSMQGSDGGFAWWPGGRTDAFMTGYATWSLALAREAGVDVPTEALARAADWLRLHLVEAENDVQLAAWELHAWTAARRALDGRATTGRREQREVERAFALCYGGREALGAYGRAALLLAAVELGREDEVDVLTRNLLDGVVRDDGSGGLVQPGVAATGRVTAHWGEGGIGRRWSEDGIEATAFSVRALLAVDPDHELIDPAVEWLVLNRRGARWKSTRDTAISVFALVDVVEHRGELTAPGEFRLDVDGREVGGGTFDPEHAWIAPLRWPVRDLGPGEHTVVLRQVGEPRKLWWHVTARTFSIEERIAPRANELVVRRDVYRLAGRETLLAGTVFERELLTHGDRVESGERIEVVLTLQTRAPLEYVIVEDRKPAGFEAVELQSGGPAHATELRADEILRRFGTPNATQPETTGDGLPSATRGTTGRTLWVYREYRDTRAVSFIDRLPEGTFELRTTYRAELPGTYAALPATAAAMYAPDLAGNSWELEVVVVE